jgi:outer membrane protein assembly factor BamB
LLLLKTTRRLVLLFAPLALPCSAGAADWPAWRGPTGQGVTAETDLPLRWSATEHVLWKTALPGPGNSTPIVWGERVLVTQALQNGKERMLLCFDRKDGSLEWKRAIEYLEKEPTHEDNHYASASPVTDGERVIVSYGSAGVLAYDLEGKELWRRDLGKFHHIWGNASSPVIHGDLCLLNCGPGERSRLTALEKRSGKTVWEVEIPGGQGGGDVKSWTGSWSTPLVYGEEGREEVLVGYPGSLRGYAPATGKELWRASGLGRLVYTSPLAGQGIAVAASGFMGPALAVRLGGEGEVTGSRLLWRHEKNQQRIGSGVITGGRVYFMDEPGIVECLELESGRQVWKERLGAASWSSLLLSGDRIYVPDQDGETFVFRAAPKFELLARNPLRETTRGSIAPSEGQLFIRTYQHLWCIGNPGEKAPVTLFDGKTLQGWKVVGCEAVVDDGAILLKAGNGMVRTERIYRDFVLALEWKALKPDNWDSGVYFRSTDPPPGSPWPKTYQANLKKGDEGNVAELKEARSKGLTRPGEWNRFKLTVVGSTAELEINEKPAWKAGGVKTPEGFIALQAEIPGGGQFLFRKITILELGKGS